MDWSRLKHAIIVCGHAVYNGGPNLTPATASLDQNWSLQSFQSGEPPFFIQHIHRGVQLTATDPNALLIFSGGQTRPKTILSEAQGYYHIAQLHAFWNHNIQNRITTEEFATDSYDNVLFGITRFTEAVGTLPLHVTVVSWAFKEHRFRHHAWSLRWPLSRFSFEACGVPIDLDKAVVAEQNTLKLFQDDPTGRGGTSIALEKKKIHRNPYRRQHGYAVSCPTFSKVLAWNGHPRIDIAHVPWNDTE